MNNAQIKALTPATAATRVFGPTKHVDGELPAHRVLQELVYCERGYCGGERRARWIRRQLVRLDIDEADHVDLMAHLLAA